MTTWLELSGLSGYYESDHIPLSLDGDGAISKINWLSIEPISTSITIFTSISFDGGYDWTDWKQCFQGSLIPDILPSTPLGSALLRFRVFLKSQNPIEIPVLTEVSFEFEPVLIFDNKGDSVCQPEVWITKNGNGDISLINTSKGNEEFKFVNLVDNETVYVNSEREYIETSFNATYRYSNFNDTYLNLPIGMNVFQVKGSAKIQFRYQFKLI
jgi:hypothetical protein